MIGSSMGLVLARRWLCVLAAVVLVLALLRPPAPPGWPPAGWLLVACDVGQGDGLVLRLDAGRAMVVDAGPDPPAMGRCLDRLGIGEVPLLVLTHFHADHVDGLSGVLDHRRIGRIWVSPLASPSAGATTVRTLAASHGVPVEVPVVGSTGSVGPASWSVLGPLGPVADADPGAGAESESENDASLVLMITVSGIRILLSGDVEPAGQAALVDAGVDLRADVLKVPHHGSARQDPRFLAATHARFAIASAGVHNDYGHPAPRTVAALAGLGATVLRTDAEGSIAVVARPDHTLVAVAQRDPALTAGR
jgi:competence protein ComEC